MFARSLFTLLILIASGVPSAFAQPNPHVIRGTSIQQSKYPAVIQIGIGGGSCSATIVGPRTILTAAHCAFLPGIANGFGTFRIGRQNYRAKLTPNPGFDLKHDYEKNPDAPNEDISLGVTETDIVGVQPISLGAGPQLNLSVIYLGYGCSNNTNRGGLQEGVNAISRIYPYGFTIDDDRNGAAGCSGDSGGPSLVRLPSGQLRVIGVHSEANLKDSSWDARIDTPTAHAYIQAFITRNRAQICGANLNCN